MRLLALRRILAATDLTPASDAALDSARRLSEAAGAALHVMYVAPPTTGGMPPDSIHSAFMPDVVAALSRAGLARDRCRVHILDGDAPTGIASLAEDLGADLIVLGGHRERTRLFKERPVGSTAYAVITTANAPCLVVTRPLPLPLQRTLVATDYSETARGAMLVALTWASALRSRVSAAVVPTLLALHVNGATASGGGEDGQAAMDDELDMLKRNAGDWAAVSVRGITHVGADPVQGIVDYATHHDVELTVLGTRGMKVADQSGLGSISDAVVRQLDVAILLVPPAIWRNEAEDFEDESTFALGRSR